jgi:arsenate reductase
MKTVLFLCTGNSARSILAEAVANRLGAGRLRAFSAGSHPKGSVNPGALALLGREGYDLVGLRSKSWDEFAGRSARAIDIVITLCDEAAGESCPIWPGAPIEGHWGIPDPAAALPHDSEAAFRLAYERITSRIAALLSLPLETLSSVALAAALVRIGAGSEGATARARDGLA